MPLVKFHKYTALGNIYLVLPTAAADALPLAAIREICTQLDADGVLIPDPETGARGVRIFNPDGTEAETSGNGLRIFARYLWDSGIVARNRFAVSTPFREAACEILDGGATVSADMGRVTFWSDEIPVSVRRRREVLDEPISAAGSILRFSGANVGNPHCVIICESIAAGAAQSFGPALESHKFFPQRANVQFVEVLDRSNIRIEIWERGAGYTLASGSSSCAAAAVAHRLGHCDERIAVHMPGGVVHVELDADFRARLRGPIQFVEKGEWDLQAIPFK